MKNNLQDRLSNLDILRGLAALAVCFYHFRRDAIGGSVYNSVAGYGIYGVEIFYVISGFVIPLALLKNQFTYRKTFGFWLSRFVRLYPAYFFASAIALVLWYASTQVPGFRGAPLPPVTMPQILSNLSLLSNLIDQSWFLEVAWTLAIEAQYYVLIALMFPLLTFRNTSYRIGALILWIGFPIILTNTYLVFHWTALFGMGLLIMLYQQNLIGRGMLVVLLSASFAIQWAARSEISAFFGLSTALFILLIPPLRLPWLIWLGGISYSLYLLHQPFGGRVMNFFERFPDSPILKILALPLAISVSIGVAYVFFKTVEWPSHKLSRVFRNKL